jgi:glycine/D-amino acid oxidase-like deaminating enzyme/nitrite reductase/ring-hydroxylating ferredoxin subunit
MKTTPLWLEAGHDRRFPPLSKDMTVDVIVVGGGITGVTAAYLFKKAGFRVALLERGQFGGVDTICTTAHLTCVTDLRLHRLVKVFGREKARAVWEAGYAAIDQIVSNISAEDIDCDFEWVPGYLFAASNSKESDVKLLRRDAALAQELGIDAAFLSAVPEFKVPGVRFSHQAKFHPLKYLYRLLDSIPGNGSGVFQQTEALEFHDKPLTVVARNRKVRGSYLVLATHNPLTGKAGLLSATFLQTKLYLYTSYVLGAKLPTGVLPNALFWDTDDPYHYLRVESRRGFDYAIFGGQDHKTGQENDAKAVYQQLERELRRLLSNAMPDRRWAGQVIETNDGLPFIGETAKNQFVATGFAGNGMTFGTLAAMMAVDAFSRHKNPWADLFAPQRTKLVGGTWSYLKENKDYPYYLLRDWLGSAEGKSVKALKRNEGKILRLKGRKVAAYRDENGQVTLCSPVCTHLKCIVTWNNAEKTWDCPCHGSRFKPTGEVLSGPAEKPLEQLPVPKAQSKSK